MKTIAKTLPQTAIKTTMLMAVVTFFWPLMLSADIAAPAITPSGSAFIDACAGLGTPDGFTPLEGWSGGPATVCNNNTGAFVARSASSSGSQPGAANPFVDSANGPAQLGQIHLTASHSGDTSYFFPTAYAYGGWNDTITPTVAGLLPGDIGTWIVPITVSGTLTSSGPHGNAEAAVGIYVNGNSVTAGGPAPSGQAATDAWTQYGLKNPPTGPCVIMSGNEVITWDASSGNNNVTCPTVTINQTILFAIGVTIGQQYTIGIFGQALGREGSFGGLR